MKRTISRLLIIGVLLLGIAGCVYDPYYGYYAPGYYSGPGYYRYSPPPGQWVPGHWDREGNWVPGHWRRWVPGHYNPEGAWVPGHWSR